MVSQLLCILGELSIGVCGRVLEMLNQIIESPMCDYALFAWSFDPRNHPQIRRPGVDISGFLGTPREEHDLPPIVSHTF